MRPIHQFMAFVVTASVSFMCIAAALIYVCERLRAEHRVRDWGLYTITTTLGYAYTRTLVDEMALRILKATSKVFRAMPHAVQVDTAFMLVDFTCFFLWFPCVAFIVTRVIQLGTTAFIAEYAGCVAPVGIATSFDRILHIKANFTMQRVLHHFAAAAWLCAAMEWSPERDAAMLMVSMIDMTGKALFGFLFLCKIARQHAKMVRSQVKCGAVLSSVSSPDALSPSTVVAVVTPQQASPTNQCESNNGSSAATSQDQAFGGKTSADYTLSRSPSVRRVVAANDSIDPYILYSAERSALLGKLAFAWYAILSVGGAMVLLIVYLVLWWEQIPLSFRIASMMMAVLFVFLDMEYSLMLSQRSRIKYWKQEIFDGPKAHR